MHRKVKRGVAAAATVFGLMAVDAGPADAAVQVNGQVQAAGGPVANATVTLWEATAGDPKQLAQVKTGADGRFQVGSDQTPGKDTSLYLVAKGGMPAAKGGGDNPALALLTILGSQPPATVTVNEMTTVASVWTNAQFLDGAILKGPALSLRIAAGNVANFVDLTTGGLGTVIQDPLNSTQTPTLANFGTLADLLAGCTTQIKPDACSARCFRRQRTAGGSALWAIRWAASWKPLPTTRRRNPRNCSHCWMPFTHFLRATSICGRRLLCLISNTLRVHGSWVSSSPAAYLTDQGNTRLRQRR